MADETPSTGKPCPVCSRPANAALRPFCSKRCADIDLGRWFTESYRIPAAEHEQGEPTPGMPEDDGSA